MGYVLALAIGAVIVAVAATAVILSRPGETTSAVRYLGDHSQVVSMGHLLLTEWEISGLGRVLRQEVRAGNSILELHDNGQTVHRLAIWRGGGGDQALGVNLIAESGYIQPGEIATLDVGLGPGTHVFICTVPGHLARGMYAQVDLK